MPLTGWSDIIIALLRRSKLWQQDKDRDTSDDFRRCLTRNTKATISYDTIQCVKEINLG